MKEGEKKWKKWERNEYGKQMSKRKGALTRFFYRKGNAEIVYHEVGVEQDLPRGTPTPRCHGSERENSAGR